MGRSCSDYSAGMLTERVVIQRRTLTSDGAGGQTEAWAVLHTVSANVKAAGGSERFSSDRVEAATQWRVTMRYIAGLRESDRIKIRDRAHNIRFINNIELMNRWLEISVDGGAAT